MNVFLWEGPLFLLTYVVFGYVLGRVVRLFMARMERAAAEPALSLASDPYQIAHLRAGAGEAFKVATVALLDRGQLSILDTGEIAAAHPDTTELNPHALERDVLRYYTPARHPPSFPEITASGLRSSQACQEYLEQRKLLAGAAVKARRYAIIIPASALLIVVAGLKTAIALSHGHGNVLFLCLACIIYVAYLCSMGNRRMTGAGTALLANLEVLFARLKNRANRLTPADGSNDMALLTAVFGMSALPLQIYPYLNQLAWLPGAQSGRLRDKDGGGDAGNVSPGSSCSTGSGDSGGSSCGGGGGCGGCGS